MKTIGTFHDLASAQLARSVLEASGIPSVIPDEQHAAMDWRMSAALGGVVLQVPDEWAERATAVLREGDVADPEALDFASLHSAALDPAAMDRAAHAGEFEESEDHCPRCGSPSIRPLTVHRRLVALSMLFFPLLLVVGPVAMLRKRKLRCVSCGHVWKSGAASR